MSTISRGFFQEPSWRKIFEFTLPQARTSFVIPDLNGNIDLMYYLTIRHVAGGTNPNVWVQPNEDATAANYGYQTISGSSSTASASRVTSATGMGLCFNNTGDIALGSMLLYAKSGFVRVGLTSMAQGVVTTTVTSALFVGSVWNNTSSVINRLGIISDIASGIGADTYLELWTRR